MLIAARNAMMVGGKSILPPGARWVEYLESTGTQWIDTGFKPNPATTRLVCSLIPTTTSGTSGIFGARGNVACNVFMISAGFRLDWLYGNTSSTAFPITSGTRYEIDITARRAVINGVEYTTTNTQNNTLPYNFLLSNFTTSGGTPYSSGFTGRMEYAKLFSSNVLVRDFRPIAIGNTGYMLDLVSGEYLPYGNAGTGAFIIGPDAVSTAGGA